MKAKGKAVALLKGLFESKRRMRKEWAKRPMAEKIKDLVHIQEIAVAINPKYKKLKTILPWRIK